MSLLLCGHPQLCFCLIGYIMCSGVNLTYFPEFEWEYRNSTVHIDMSANHIKHLPNLSDHEWPKLEIVDVRTNPSIPCQEILKSAYLNQHLIIHHHCHLDPENSTFITATYGMFTNSTVATNITQIQNNNTDNSSLPNDKHGYKWGTGAFLILSELILMLIAYLSLVLYKVILSRPLQSEVEDQFVGDFEDSIMSEEDINMEIIESRTAR